MHNPRRPGLVLREYLGNVPVTKAAAHLRITRVTLSRVLNGKAGISASMAIRLAAALGTYPGIVDGHAVAVRLMEGAEGETAGGPQIGKRCRHLGARPGN
jgi:addiction module HigA family antidote